MRPYEVYLAFQHAADDASLLVDIAAQLQTNTAIARLLGVDLYYRADTDVMLLGLRFDPHTTTQALLERVHEDADRTGASILELARLSEEDRRRFHEEYLTAFPLRVRGLPTPSDAVAVFARDMGAESSSPAVRFARGTSERSRPKLEVHFARGDEWMLGRVRNLTREGVYVVAGATPRLGDIVEVRLSATDLSGPKRPSEASAAERTMTVRGQVVYVTASDATEAMGASGFGLRFHLGTPDDRQKLETIIRSTLGDGYASVRAAPPRRDVRYPVRWPVMLDLGHASANLAALDVSAHGMFVGCAAPHLPRELEVEVPIDDMGGAIRARARVARAVTPDVARSRGVAIGFGLELLAFTQSDEQRFRMFVARIGRRSERSIVVAGAPDRASEIAWELAGAGYAAQSATDPDGVLDRTRSQRPPDLVIVDESLERTSGPAVRSLRRNLARLDVPCCFVEGEQPASHARSLADATLLS